MSNAVFPALPGLKWDVTKTPSWKTNVQQSVGGKELRASFMSSPLWKWTLAYEVLRQGAAFLEFQTLAGFFNARQGKFDSFLYNDPSDNTVTGQNFGTGDGVKTSFQLVRDFGAGGFTGRENVYDLNTVPALQVYLNGVLQTTGYTENGKGLIAFSSPPGVGVALTWTGGYYWRVRFDLDAAEFGNFANQFWEAKTISFVTVK